MLAPLWIAATYCHLAQQLWLGDDIYRLQIARTVSAGEVTTDLTLSRDDEVVWCREGLAGTSFHGETCGPLDRFVGADSEVVVATTSWNQLAVLSVQTGELLHLAPVSLPADAPATDVFEHASFVADPDCDTIWVVLWTGEKIAVPYGSTVDGCSADPSAFIERWIASTIETAGQVEDPASMSCEQLRDLTMAVHLAGLRSMTELSDDIVQVERFGRTDQSERLFEFNNFRRFVHLTMRRLGKTPRLPASRSRREPQVTVRPATDVFLREMRALEGQPYEVVIRTLGPPDAKILRGGSVILAYDFGQGAAGVTVHAVFDRLILVDVQTLEPAWLGFSRDEILLPPR